jgi:anti-anti-sigma factor
MAADPLRVLLVEDNPVDVGIVQGLLAGVASPKWEVEHVDHLAAGLKRLAEPGVDVVLLDLLLPDSQDLDTFRQVDEQAPWAPVVIMTSMDDEQMASEAVQKGAQDYLVKGQVTRQWLSRSLFSAIERKRREARAKPRDAEAAPPAPIAVSQEGPVTVVRLADRTIVDPIRAQQLGLALVRLVSEDRPLLVLNLEGVDFLSNPALGVLIGLDRRIKAVQGRLLLCNVAAGVLEHFAVRRLDRMFEFRDTEQAAVKELG